MAGEQQRIFLMSPKVWFMDPRGNYGNQKIVAVGTSLKDARPILNGVLPRIDDNSFQPKNLPDVLNQYLKRGVEIDSAVWEKLEPFHFYFLGLRTIFGKQNPINWYANQLKSP